MFTHRICCCAATTASQVMAVIAIILSGIVCASNWFAEPALPLYLNIYTSVLVGLEILACVLVFVACFSLRAALVIPIIVIQAWNTISTIGTGIWSLIDLWDSIDVWEIILYILMYIVAINLSLFVLHCHTCCYKLLLIKRRVVHH
ncbi:hypothetical protein PRIPAC_76767 [Pristionchus pacificus]|nr:hypothetical protein PRIPAC_76767 [Pristionchus pacificus]